MKQNKIFFLEEESEAIKVVIKERLRTDQVGPLFESELIAPTDQEMTNDFTVAATARTRLVELYDGVPPAHRNRKIKADEWSLADHLQHLLRAEAHYVGCLHEQLPEDPLPVPEEELPTKFLENGMIYERFLRGLTPERRAHVYTHGEAQWTTAKVLRRMTEHLRDHYPWMQTIAWQLCASD